MALSISMLLNEEMKKNLREEIKKKKELRNISDKYLDDRLDSYFRSHNNILKSLPERFNPKSAVIKNIVKEIRKNLRQVYGLFRTEEHQLNDLVEEWIKASDKKKDDLLREILKTHSSTKERLDFYLKLYQKIFQITGKPESIIDLGSGINPFSLFYMKLKRLKYLAYDISKEETDVLNKFFDSWHQKNNSFSGKAEIFDFLDQRRLQEHPKADLAFLFKVTDILDKGKSHKRTEEVIMAVPARYVIVSFPTMTMSGKKMNFPRRKWIELMCQRLDFKYEILEFSNEIFYVIQK